MSWEDPDRHRRRRHHHHHHRPAWASSRIGGDLVTTEYSTAVAALERENKSLREELRDLRREAEENRLLRQEQLRLTDECRDLTASQGKWRDHIAELTERNAGLVRELEAVQDERRALQAELAALKSRLSAADDTERQLVGLRTHQTQLVESATSVEARNKQLEADLAAAQRGYEGSQAALQRAEREVAELRGRIVELEGSHSKAVQANVEAGLTVDALQVELEQARRHEQAMLDSARAAETGVLGAATEAQQCRTALQDTEARLHQAVAELTTLSQVVLANTHALQLLQAWCQDAGTCLSTAAGAGLPRTPGGDVSVVCPPGVPDLTVSETPASDLPGIITGRAVDTVAADAASRLERIQFWIREMTGYLDRAVTAALIQHGEPPEDGLSVAEKLDRLQAARARTGIHDVLAAQSRAEAEREAYAKEQADRQRREAEAEAKWGSIHARTDNRFDHLEGAVDKLVREVINSRSQVSELQDKVAMAMK